MTINNISKKILKKYLSNNLSKAKLNELNNVLRNDNFLADAVEGYNQFPNEINNIPKINNTTLKIIMSSSVIIAAVIYMYFLSTNVQKEITKPQYVSSKSKLKLTTISAKLANSTNATKKIKTTFNNTKPKTFYSPKKKFLKLNNQRDTFSLFNVKSTSKIIIPKTPKKLKYKAEKLITYYNYWAIDNSILYTKTNKQTTLGTPPTFANKHSITTDLLSTISIDYYAFMKQSFKYLSEQKFELALTNFKVLYKHSPNDVNAQFYIGLIQYKLANKTESLHYINQVINNPNSVFFIPDAKSIQNKLLQ